MIALKAARLIDGTGSGMGTDVSVLVEGETIKAVEKGSVALPTDAELVDLGNRTLLPGLIDAHVHFSPEATGDPYARLFEPSQRKLIRATIEARNALAAGFTTMRDMGGRDAVYLRDAITAGEIPGPRILACGLILTCTGGSEDPLRLLPPPFLREWAEQLNNMTRVVSGPDDCREAVREQYRLGADWIKYMSTGSGMIPQFTYEETLAIIDEAHRLGMKVATHTNGGQGMKDALKAGVNTVEHGTVLDEQDLAFMKEHDVLLCPTLAILDKIVHEGPRHGVEGHVVTAAQERYKKRLNSLKRAYECGLKIMMGTDFGIGPYTRHGGNVYELELMVKAGCKPMDVVLAATKYGAEGLGLADRLGTVEDGKLADLIAVPGNPLEQIHDLYQVDFVMKGGAIFRKPD